MATKTVTMYADDLDGSPLDAEEVNTLHFMVENDAYVVDLSPAHAQDFRELLQRYIEAGRKLPAGYISGKKTTTSRKNPETALIRQWAKEKGLDVADRGRIHQDVVEMYHAEKSERSTQAA